jgi:hypothetical protein
VAVASFADLRRAWGQRHSLYDGAGVCQYENGRTTPGAAEHAVKGARWAFISTLDSGLAVSISSGQSEALSIEEFLFFFLLLLFHFVGHPDSGCTIGRYS